MASIAQQLAVFLNILIDLFWKKFMKTLEPLRKTFVGCRVALTFKEIYTKNYILLKKLHLFQ